MAEGLTDKMRCQDCLTHFEGAAPGCFARRPRELDGDGRIVPSLSHSWEVPVSAVTEAIDALEVHTDEMRDTADFGKRWFEGRDSACNDFRALFAPVEEGQTT
jgi:hypothetical protein